ncbi:MAG: type I-B CRISPR-associated protein Cas7/Cst2/DevR [Deltaproteobacteria bacterium]|nr:type I-B CRISPR-associated protein Cas7/Cst2/DevR [Deltaproteobacteria bacterium]RLA87622.1 MAG: type I-B CRISPR-associated protein Cas7/Cst2/DevR [Deltaproteobacteria bacterium]
MSKHLFGMILTHQGTYANNRGETEGTATTLQKVLRNGDLYTTVSAEAIRYALREGWQAKNYQVNRCLKNHRECDFRDREFKEWHKYLDDDALGYMHAREETLSRRGLLEITRAISTTPWRGEIMQNFASPGSNPGVTHKNPIPYAVEVHDTRYQYGFALTPAFLGRMGFQDKEDKLTAKEKKERLWQLLEGLCSLRRVGGNHSRYLTDFSPEVIVLRWTDDPAPRFLYCFMQDDHGGISLDPLFRRLDGDIEAAELIIGTPLHIPELKALKDKGANFLPGVKKAVNTLMGMVQDDDLAVPQSQG